MNEPRAITRWRGRVEDLGAGGVRLPPLRQQTKAVRPQKLANGDEERWAQWREGRLLSAGFPSELAETLARQERIDLHELLKLVDRGCPPRLAARILAPLDAPLDETATSCAARSLAAATPGRDGPGGW
jgi:hypothetical protein